MREGQSESVRAWTADADDTRLRVGKIIENRITVERKVAQPLQILPRNARERGLLHRHKKINEQDRAERSWKYDRRKRRGVERLRIPPGAPLRRVRFLP